MAHAESSLSDGDLPTPPVEFLRRIALPSGVDAREWYARSGAAHKGTLARLLAPDWSWDGKSVLDFGCGVGRVLVQFLDEARRTRRFAACDIDAPSIAWLKSHFEPPFEIQQTLEDPPLPWPDGTFDLVYAASVFTHLTDSWAHWLTELHRVLAPDGLAIVTIISGAFAERWTGEPWNPNRIGMNVLYWGNAWEDWGPAVLHSEWWIRAHWGRAFDVVEFAAHGFDGKSDDPSGGQGWVILRKRPIAISPEALEAIEPSEPREWEALRHNLRQVQREAMRSLTTARQLTAEHEQHERVRGERDYMLRSLSWRATAPLRAVRSLLRGGSGVRASRSL